MNETQRQEQRDPPAAAAQPDPPLSPRWDSLRARAERAEDVLRAVARAVQRSAGSDARGGGESLSLRLSMTEPRGESLFDQMARDLRDRAADAEAFSAGHVYCYWCRSAACEHGTPARASSVFAGYASTGQPTWQDLVQPLIDAGDPRVDRLFARPRQPVALVQTGRDLKRELLHSFGRASKTYDILGQVVAGQFHVHDSPADPGDRDFAVTFQVIESRGPNGEIRLNLNLLARPPAGAHPRANPNVDGACRYAESRLRRMERALKQSANGEARNRILAQVPAVLRKLAGALDRSTRQNLRRTHHRNERGKTRAQAHKAMDDLQAARDDQILHDERRSTMIVLGARHRVHAFSADARHVTTFTMLPESVARRLRTRRWRPATPDEIAGLRKNASAAAPTPEA